MNKAIEFMKDTLFSTILLRTFSGSYYSVPAMTYGAFEKVLDFLEHQNGQHPALVTVKNSLDGVLSVPYASLHSIWLSHYESRATETLVNLPKDQREFELWHHPDPIDAMTGD